jgi:hypothetical protein
MANAFLRGSRLLALSVGLLFALGLLVGLDGEGFAQTTKTKPKTPPTKTPPTKITPVETYKPVTFAPSSYPVATEEPVKAINELLEKAWKENKLEPSGVCTDYEFIRRASLDIIGRIATPEEIDRYLKDPPQTRRALLIDRLLGKTVTVTRDGKQEQEPDKFRQEYAANWAQMWTNWLLTRTGSRLYREQMQVALEDEFLKDTMSYKEMVHQLLTATGRTNANGFVNYILAHLGEPIPQGKQTEEGQFEMVPVTSRTTRLFLGYQTQCTQCHDHPFNPEWKQNHFWGVNAFFRQVQRIGQPLPPNQAQKMGAAVLELRDVDSYNKDGIIYYEKRNGVVLPTKSVFLDGKKIPADSKLSRREVLSNYVTNHEQFPKAFVNRMWGHFFGRSMNENPPVDDFGEHNKVIHPELLDRLAKAFASSGGYDPKNLIRWICTSRAYSLSVVANSTNNTPDAEPFFSRMLLKAMSPEQMFESLMTATSGSESRDARKARRERWMNALTANFGDDEGNEITFNGTVVQALLMMNGQDLNEAVTNPNGTPAQAMKRGNPRAIMDELFLAALNRRTTTNEFQIIMEKLKMRRPDRDPAHPWQDLFWALLNSNEFILNH